MSKLLIALLGLFLSFSAHAQESLNIPESLKELVPAFSGSLSLTSADNRCQLDIKPIGDDFYLTLAVGSVSPLIFRSNNIFTVGEEFEPVEVNPDDTTPYSEEGYYYSRKFYKGQAQFTLIETVTYYAPTYPVEDSVETVVQQRKLTFAREGLYLKLNFDSRNSYAPKYFECKFAL